MYGVFFIAAGVMHFLVPKYYQAIVPFYLPAHPTLVVVSGVAEIAGGLGLLLPPLRSAAGIGLIGLLIAVFPANVEMLRIFRERGVGGWTEAVLWLRLPLQALLIWWAWLLSRPTAAGRA
jgi:uncharacterized membrane protein